MGMPPSVKVVAVGPGGRDYACQAALDAIQEARVLVGGRRLLESYAHPGQAQYPLESDLSGALQFILQEAPRGKVVVLVSGDTGIFSFADYLRRNLKMEEEELEFIPGISSFQLLFARIKRSWKDAAFISVHGRPPGYLSRVVREENTTVIFTGKQWSPPAVARYLLEEGVPDMKVVVGKDLSYPQEEIVWNTLSGLATSSREFANSLLVVLHE